MILIAAADRNWGIGLNNELLTHIPADQKFFRETTTGNVVVMGRRTLESLPKGEPLKNRINIVLTGNPAFKKEGVTVVYSIEELLKEIEKYPGDSVFCIGGAKVYKELLPYCNKALITRIDEEYEADVFLPDLDALSEWRIAEESEEQTYFDLVYHFVTYKKENNNGDLTTETGLFQ